MGSLRIGRGIGTVNAAMARRRLKWLSASGLTIRKVADALNEDYNTVMRWFKDGRTPRHRYLEAVVAAFPTFPHDASLRRASVPTEISPRRNLPVVP